MSALEANRPVLTDEKKHTVFLEKSVAHFSAEGVTSGQVKLLVEEPLSIRVQGKPYAVIMRTPGDETAHAVGFCLSEGIIDSYADIKQIAFCGDDTNVVTVLLHPARVLKIGNLLERRGFVSQTSCGICGKEVVRDMIQSVQPITNQTRIHWEKLLTCKDHFFKHQSLYHSTRTSHAAMAFGKNLVAMAIGEDVGRHNAVDKVIGRLTMDNNQSDILCLVLSSRISFELVQKAARAGIPIILSISRPTLLAVELAARLNITLAYAPSEEELTVYCGVHRIRKK